MDMKHKDDCDDSSSPPAYPPTEITVYAECWSRDLTCVCTNLCMLCVFCCNQMQTHHDPTQTSKKHCLAMMLQITNGNVSLHVLSALLLSRKNLTIHGTAAAGTIKTEHHSDSRCCYDHCRQCGHSYLLRPTTLQKTAR